LFAVAVSHAGVNDTVDRVPPWDVAKMAARLQAATTSGKPVLLRADEQGHGLVRDVAPQIDEDADVYTFMLWQLGEPGFQTR
jgi:prolyl oligopeptidase